MTLPSWIDDFRHTKAYDLLMAVPLIAWFGRGAFIDAGHLLPLLDLLRAGTLQTIQALQLAAMTASLFFCALLIVMLLIRTKPRARAEGWAPRALAVVGTFLGTGFLYLTPVALPLWLQSTAIVLLVIAAGIEIYVMVYLGRSFSIMAEARQLVTDGPYALVRHPLYSAEAIGLSAMLIQFFGLGAAALFLGWVAAQAGRAIFEERILMATFGDYAAYKARTKRFIPLVY